nr:nuclease-related domain-containing protein [uncultured Flavobacterium sp.]
MCKVYNQIGSLTNIKSHLRQNNVNDFNSINELLNFQKNYSKNHQQIISNHSILIEEEKTTLIKEIEELEKVIKINKIDFTKELQLELNLLKEQLKNLLLPKSNIIKITINYFKKNKVKRKIQDIELNFDSKVANFIKPTTINLNIKKNRYEYISTYFSEAVNQSSHSEINELERKIKIIGEINNSIYGAIGENKVLNALENLSDDYILINDFVYNFYPSIYNRQENDYIKSIQIDHILISPAGIFLIETKNWSENSLNNFNLRSPVEQVIRTNFAIYKLLTKKTNLLDKHHWGNRKMPIRNIIVLINQKPNEEFQYVKILTLSELCNYIEYFKPNLSPKETQTIANYLLELNESRN